MKGFLVFYIVLLSVLLGGDYPLGFDRKYVGWLLACVAIISVFFVRRLSRTRRLNIYTPSLLCFLSIVIVHFQSYLDMFFGAYISEGKLFSSVVIPEAGAVSVIGLASYVLGWLLESHFRAVVTTTAPRIYSPTIVVVGAYVSYALFLLVVSREYLMGVYDGGLSWSQTAQWANMLQSSFMYAIIILTYNNLQVEEYRKTGLVRYVRRIGLVSSLPIAMSVLISFYVGDRGPVISYTIAYFAYYFIHCARLTALRSVALVMGTAALMTLIAHVRTSDLWDNQTLIERYVKGVAQVAENSDASESFFPFTQELASSVRCLHASIEYIPDNVPYGYGRYTLFNLVTLMPFMDRLFFKNANDYKRTTRLYTDLINNDNPNAAGAGTTVIADFYGEFGVMAVMIGMGLLGFLVGLCDRIIIGGTPVSLFWLCVALLYLARSIYVSRAQAIIPLKSAIYTYMIIEICNIFLSRHLRTETK